MNSFLSVGMTISEVLWGKADPSAGEDEMPSEHADALIPEKNGSGENEAENAFGVCSFRTSDPQI